ncbi:MAG: type IV secretory system conjugative DNA transfer family protein [Ruminococcus sp.]|nr:type IV secretory system conjugative DNA transfer family protein [Ruminococcus sp.]
MKTKQKWLNDNTLVIGTSGSGKTTSVIQPFIVGTHDSFICADTKGNLYRRHARELEDRGYSVYCLDMTDPKRSVGYDPLSYIGRYTENGVTRYDEKDILSLANTLVPEQDAKEPFWEEMAKNIISMLIAYVLEAFDESEKDLTAVADCFKLVVHSSAKKRIPFMDEHCVAHPNSFASRKYQMVKGCMEAERMWSSIQAFIVNALNIFDFDGTREMITKPSSFRIEDMGSERCAVFVNVSDSDSTLDPLVNTFYTQCFQTLLRTADSMPDSKLKVPVKILLDDFATSCQVPEFDKLISVIRSRNISTTVILQSVSQLYSIYGSAKSATIMMNCDTCCYLGGCDQTTVDYIARRLSKPFDQIMRLPVDKAYVLVRGSNAVIADKTDPALTSRDSETGRFESELINELYAFSEQT